MTSKLNIFSVIAVLALTCLWSSPATAANPYLVKDINTTVTAASSSPANLVVCNGVLYFTATTVADGTELWKSDGTPAGTTLVKDINPGMGSSSPANLTVLGTTVYFTANDGVSGTELWKTDGTAAGSVLVKDINVAPGMSSSPGNLTVMDSNLYLTANDGNNGIELWRSNGTSVGTFMTSDINPGSGSSSPYNLKTAGINDLLFTADDGVNGPEVWRYMASSNSTFLVKNINNTVGSGSYPSSSVELNYVIYFSANDGTGGYEPWKSNGTAWGTTRIADLYPGTIGSSPSNLTFWGTNLYFSARDSVSNGYALWKFDTNTSTLTMVTGSANTNPSQLTVLGAYLYFQGYDSANGNELWRTNGSTAARFSDINPTTGSSSPANLTVMGSYLYFRAYDTTNSYAIWRTNGSLIEIVTGSASTSFPSNLTVMTNSNGTYLYYQGYDATYGSELRRIDGSTKTAALVKDINTSNSTGDSYPGSYATMGTTLYFSANDVANGYALWKSDGTTLGTTMVTGGANSEPSNLTTIGSYVYFRGHNANGYELWRSNGTSASQLTDINPTTGSSYPSYMTLLNSSVYFSANDGSTGYALWKYSTTLFTTTKVSGTENFSPAYLTAIGSYIYFKANDGINGDELWLTDGTNIWRLSNINASGNSNIGNLTVMGGNLYFTAYDGTNYAMWKCNTSTFTVSMVPNTSNASVPPAHMTVMGSYIYFNGGNLSDGYELWKTDGTTTTQVKDIYTGASSSSPYNLTVLSGSTLYFVADDGVHGSELWKSDGTTNGTTLVADIYPGSMSSSPAYLSVSGSYIYFVASSPETGQELWKSEGTAAGTIPVGELKPGSLSTSIYNLAAVNSRIFFVAQDPVAGNELFAFDTAYPTGTIEVASTAGYVTLTSVTLNLTCSDSGVSCSQMQFSTDNLNWSTAEAFSTSKSWTLASGDGPKLVYVKYRDNSGNWSNPYQIKLVLDTSTPATYLTAYPPALTTTNTTTFKFTSNETTNFECLLDDDPAGFKSCTSPKVYNLFAGTHQFQVRAVDPAGHVDPNPVQYSWTIFDTLDGAAFGWGQNSSGQIGMGTTDVTPHPIRERIPSPINFIQLSAGGYHSVGLRNDGTVWVWGYSNGAYNSSPTQISGLTDVVSVAAGYDFSVALKSDGTVWHWGTYYYNSTSQRFATPTQVAGISGVTAVSAGVNHALALRTGGQVWAWGYNEYGEAGPDVPINTFQDTPIYITTLSGITAIRAAENSSYALKNNGTIWAWGYNAFGQLGNGSSTNSASPVQVSIGTGMTNVKTLATGAGGNHMMAIDAAGTAWGWGYNYFGQLGLGTGQYNNSHNQPQQLGTLANITAISIGRNFSLFLTKGNTVWSAGYNTDGELGQGLYDSRQDHSAPDMVGYLNGAFYVAAGYYHGLALTTKWVTNSLRTSSGSKSSIALDASDNPNIAYTAVSSYPSVALYYQTSTNRAWNTPQVADATLTSQADGVSLVIDRSNYAHICYQQRNTSSGLYEVRYTTNKGGSWQAPYVINTSSTYTDNNCSIAYTRDQQGKDWIYVSYYVPSASCGTLKLATKYDTDPWDLTATIEDGCPNNYVGRSHSIAIDSYNTVMAAYTASGAAYSASGFSVLRYAEGGGSTWTRSTVDATGTEKVPSIAVVPASQNPAIAYAEQYSCAPATCYKLKYAETDGTVWSVSTVDNYDNRSVGDSLDLAFSKDSIPYISYHDQTGDDLRVAIGSADRTAWRLNAVDTDGSIGKNSAIAVDSLNAAHISYYNSTSPYGLKYATNLDADSPVGSVTIMPTAVSGTTNYVKSKDVTLALTCDDGIGVDGHSCWQMKISNDSNFTNENTETFVTGRAWALNTANGIQSVYAKFRDSANNWSPVYSGSIFLDTVAPSGTLTVSSATYPYTNTPFIALQTSCTDPGVVGTTSSGCGTMQFSTDPGLVEGNWSVAQPYGTSASIIVSSSPGTKFISVRYIDKAGNISPVITKTVTLDTDLPINGAFTITSGATTTSTTVVTLNNISCTDDAGGTGCKQMQFRNENGNWSDPVNLATSLSWTLSSGDGTKTVHARFIDNAGNPSVFSLSRNITLDTTAPVGTVKILDDATFTNTTAVTLNLTCSDSLDPSCYQMSFSSDGVNWTSPEGYSSTKSYTLSGEQSFVWGANKSGQLGIGDGQNVTSPYPLSAGNAVNSEVQWRQIAPGYRHTAAIRSDGTLWTWGENSYGQLGLGDTVSKSTPQQVGIDTNWSAVTVGGYHTLALKANGSLWAWGNNYEEELGDGTTEPQSLPIQILSGYNWKAISAGLYHSAALSTDGELFTWGYNGYGQLGNDSFSFSSPPAHILPGTAWQSLSAGVYHSAGVTSEGRLYTWGYNGFGQLGSGDTSNYAAPNAVDMDTDWASVAAGGFHTLALKSSGNLYAFGDNSSGAVGDGSREPQLNKPVAVAADSTWKMVVGGFTHSAGIKTNDTLWGWGDNSSGQLGCGEACSALTDTPQLIDTKYRWKYIFSATGQSTAGIRLDDERIVYVRFSDHLDNWSNPVFDTIILDKVPPSKPIVSGPTPTNNTNPTWSWSSGGGGTGFYRFKVDDNNLEVSSISGTGTSHTPAGSLGQGSHTLWVQEQDKAGNWSEAASFSIMIDTSIKPSPQVNGVSPVNSQNPTWTWTSNGVGNGEFQVILDADFPTECPGALAWTTATSYTHMTSLLPEGGHTLNIRERDAAGNCSATGSRMVTVDITPPGVPENNNSTPSPTNNSTPTWHWRSNVANPGNGQFKYRLDDSNLADVIPTVATVFTPGTALSEGQHNLYIQERDAAGNWSGTKTLGIFIDSVPPAGSIAINNSAPYVNGFAVNLSLTATDASPPVQMQFCNANHVTGVCVGSWSALKAFNTSENGWSLLAGEGTKRVNIMFRDAANNQSSPTATFATIIVDSIAPIATLSVNSGVSSTGSEVVSLTINSVVDASPIDYIKISNTNTPEAWTAAGVESYSGDINQSAVRSNWVLDTAEGTKTVYVKLQDRSGLWSNAIASQAITLDKSAPSGTIAISSGATKTKNDTVDLQLSCSDLPLPINSGCSRMQFSNDGTTWGGVSAGDGLDIAVGASKTGWPLTSGDGPKTIYARFKDNAGNWSAALGPAAITLDKTAPQPDFAFTNTVKDSSDVEFVKNSSVVLSVSASDLTGMGQMQFCNAPSAVAPCGESDWLAAETFGASKTMTLIGSDGIKKIGMKASDGAGNWSAEVYKTVTLDMAAPVTSTSPVAGSKTTTQSVSLACSDGSGIDKTGCDHIYFSTDGSPPATLYASPFTIAKDTTVKYYAVDSLGNTEVEKSVEYTFIRGFTELTLELTDPTIDFNKTETVFGRLINLSGNNANLVGEKITITVKDVDGIEANHEITINDPLGSYSQTISGFTKKGAYTLSATFAGSTLSHLLAPSASTKSTLLVGASAGYAILIEGKIANDPDGLAAHNLTANRIYQKLKNRGFLDENIYYFNYDRWQSGVNVDATPTASDIQYAIETWVKSRMNSMPAPLYIIMVDHGSSNGEFHLNNETITPTDLAAWLSKLESGDALAQPPVAGLSAEALKEKRFIINGSCYSGTFITDLSQPPTATNGGRVVITSAATDEVSYKGPNEGNNARSGEFFLEEFFTQLERGYTFRQAFVDATTATRLFTQKGGNSGNSNAPYFDGAVQHPMLDDNGDGIGSNALYDGTGQDGDSVRNMILGAGANYSTNSAENPVDITAVTETVFLTSTQTGKLLWATVNDDTQVDSAVWMEIRTPSSVLTPAASTVQADLDTRRIPLAHVNDRWEQDPSDVALAIDLRTPFTSSGKYEILYFVRDLTTQKLAPMKRSVVYKANSASDPLPGAFNLLTPDGVENESNMIVFSWSPSSSANTFTYTLLVASDPAFSTIVYKQEDITGTMVALGSEMGLKTGMTYYWKVQAIDIYGATRDSSQTDWHFHTAFPNDFPGIIQGYVRDPSGIGISGVTVYANALTKTTNADGAFAFVVTAGTYSMSASKNSFSSLPTPVSVAAGGNQNIVITLDMVSPVVSVFTIPSTSNSLTVPVTTLTATDNAGSASLKYCITEVNSSAGCSWGTKPTSFNVSSTGALTLHAWAKDTSGNISAGLSAPVQIQLTDTIGVSISGTGTGRVYSAPTNSIDCTYVSIMTGTCSFPFDAGSTVGLIAAPDWNSGFDGWGGDYSGTGECWFSPLSANRNVTAIFTLYQLAKTGVQEYSTIQDAYDNAAPLTGGTVKVKQFTFKEDLIFDTLDKIVTIEGGKDLAYADQADAMSTVEGSMTIKQGTVKVYGLTIRQKTGP